MSKILFTGDFCPAGSVEKIALEGDPTQINSVFEEIVPYTTQSDYVVVNLECPLTRSQSAIEKTGPNLKANPKTIVLLKNLGVDLVALANNHVYDYGETGLKDTLNTCREYGIGTVGAGETLAEAQSIFVALIKGKRVAFVNFAENEFCNADAGRGGANPLDIIDNTRQIHAAREQADAVIVIIHGGHEHFHYPSPRMVKTYRFFAEQGATAIIAHHPHCVCGYEVHDGVPIFYSLGNFLFSRDTNFEGWYLGYMVQLHIGAPGGCEFSIIPYSQCRGDVAVRPLEGIEGERFEERLKELSAPLAAPNALQGIWEDFAKKRERAYVYSLSPVTKRVKQVLGKLGASRLFLPRRYALGLFNRLRCENHRDLMLHALGKWLAQKKS